jgi:hypothetical protein
VLYNPTSNPSQAADPIERTCLECGCALVGLRADARCCDDTCSRRYRRRRARTSDPDGVRVGSADFKRCTAELSGISPCFTGVHSTEKTGGSVAHIAGPAAVVAAELGTGWRTAVSLDGVVTEVRQLRTRTLVNPGNSAATPTGRAHEAVAIPGGGLNCIRSEPNI